MATLEPPTLGKETRDLLDAARGAHDPNELNRARVRRGVEIKLAAGLGLALGPATSAFAGAAKLTLVVAAVGTVVGAGAAYKTGLVGRAFKSSPAPVAMRAAPRTPPLHATETLPPPAEPPAAAAERPVRRRAHATPAAPVESASALAEETALLGAANTALAHRDVASALALLEDYDHRPGSAILGEERTVTGILTLCAAGRTDGARAEARHFRARWPHSPLTARVEDSCVGTSRANRSP